MSWVKASDPLALLAIQAGHVPNPSIQEGASGSSRLDVDQRSVDIGEPVPIVFARRRNNAGGILISPGATEARFENDTSNNVTAYYHLVLGEGQMDPIPVKDVFQRACRVGSHTQTYSRRAGTWVPGNFIVEREGYDKPEASYICGSIGLYYNATTLSFQVTIPDGFDYWRRQVHVFIRGGMWVTRLVDSVTGPSDNFADLVHWMLQNSGRVPSALIDTAALTDAAEFLEANGFTCNCWLQQAENFGDFIAKWSPYFLLGESNAGGKKGLRPLLPVNNDGTIKTTAITPEYIFTEDEILPGTFDIEYTSWADRQSFVAQMTWRQELGDDAAIIRTADVRFVNSADAGPYELHDMSAFCTSEAHAVKAGAYIIARRRYVSHTIRFSARPQAHNRLLVPGSIIRVRLQRTASGGGPSEHDYLYQVERITKTLAGDVGYECSHFPVDDQLRSIVAQIVTTASGSGILFDTNSTGVGCDINSATDNTIPDEEFTVPDLDDFDPGDFETVIDDIDIPEIGGGGAGGSGGGGGLGGGDPNETDSKDATPLGPLGPGSGYEGAPQPGDTFDVPEEACEGGQLIRTIAEMDADGGIIPGTTVQEQVDSWSIPIGIDINYKYISFSIVCPSGEEQAADPIVIAEQQFSDWPECYTTPHSVAWPSTWTNVDDPSSAEYWEPVPIGTGNACLRDQDLEYRVVMPSVSIKFLGTFPSFLGGGCNPAEDFTTTAGGGSTFWRNSPVVGVYKRSSPAPCGGRRQVSIQALFADGHTESCGGYSNTGGAVELSPLVPEIETRPR